MRARLTYAVAAMIAGLTFGLAFAPSVSAATLTFEDGNDWFAIQDGYEGLNWQQDGGNFNFGGSGSFGFSSKFAYLNSGDPGDTVPQPGFIGANDGQIINLSGGDFSANWANGLDLTVSAFLDGNSNGSVSINDLGYRTPQSQTFDLTGDRIEFAVSGPITLPNGSPLYDWQQYAFGMDNLNVELTSAETGGSAAIPVPATFALLGIGLFGVGIVGRRRL